MDNNNRRDFLKNLGTIGLGVGTMTTLSSMSLESEPISGEKIIEFTDAKGEKTTTVSILQTTDVHCQIHPHDELFWENEKIVFRKTGGYAQMATMLKNFKAKNKNTFIIDTGDMFQGSALSVKTTGEVFVPILNALDYNLYLPGNWEVIYGKKKMQTLMGSLQAPKICANMYHDLGEGKRGELIFQPYHIWTVAGAKIGFLGYTDPLVPVRQSPNYSKGILYTKPEENLAHYIDVLKNQEQCSFIILLSHLGLSQQIALANLPECKGVDYILGGDTHERIRKPIVCKYSKVVEPGAFGSFIGKLDLNIKDGKVISDTYDLVEVAANKIKPDAKVSKLLKDKQANYLSEIETVVGYSTIPLYRYFVVENPIDTLIVKALHWRFPEIDIVLSNGFRFCPPKATPDLTGNIPITKGYIFDMLPVDSTVRTAKVTGQQLMDWLEKELNNVFAKDASKRLGGWLVKFKGMEMTFNAFAEMGKRVQTLTINGQAINTTKIYSILACERDGDPEDMLCRLKGVSEAKNTKDTLHIVMQEYLKVNSPVTPTPEKNAIILDAKQTLLSQVTDVDYQFR
jgi:2',3'-cyclic-nucleotide 2'-phosphodiesterase (5'-nucleotidase family)